MHLPVNHESAQAWMTALPAMCQPQAANPLAYRVAVRFMYKYIYTLCILLLCVYRADNALFTRRLLCDNHIVVFYREPFPVSLLYSFEGEISNFCMELIRLEIDSNFKFPSLYCFIDNALKTLLIEIDCFATWGTTELLKLFHN